MAFTLTDDHGRQFEVWAQLSWNKSPEMIRKLLTQSHVGPSDRRVRFVGAEAPEQAGGTILRDLFVEDHGGYFTDSQLLDRLVLEKLEDAGEEVSREGWKWVAVYPEYPYNFVHALRRIYPHSVPLSERRARSSMSSLPGTMRSSPSTARSLRRMSCRARPPGRGDRLDPAALPKRTLPEDLSRAGAIVSLSSEGALRVERGFIKPEDAVQPISGRSGSAQRRQTDVTGSHRNHDDA